jgi:hypothetical protein
MTKDALDYVEQQGLRNIEFHVKGLESLQKEAHLTLTVSMAAMSAAFTSAFGIYTKAGWMWATVLWLLSVYFWFVTFCMTKAIVPRTLFPTGNEPKNLIPFLGEQGFTLEQVREKELLLLQERIENIIERNQATGKIIQSARRLLIFSPAAFLAFLLILGFVRWTLTFGA